MINKLKHFGTFQNKLWSRIEVAYKGQRKYSFCILLTLPMEVKINFDILFWFESISQQQQIKQLLCHLNMSKMESYSLLTGNKCMQTVFISENCLRCSFSLLLAWSACDKSCLCRQACILCYFVNQFQGAPLRIHNIYQAHEDNNVWLHFILYYVSRNVIYLQVLGCRMGQERLRR